MTIMRTVKLAAENTSAMIYSNPCVLEVCLFTLLYVYNS